MSAAPGTLRKHDVASGGSFKKLSLKQAGDLEKLFLGMLGRTCVKIVGNGKIAFVTEKNFDESRAFELVASPHDVATRSKADENNLRVDHEVDIWISLGSSAGGKQVQPFRWARFDVQLDTDSAGGIAIPVNHGVPLGDAFDLLVTAATTGKRICIWNQVNASVMLDGTAVAVPEDCIPIASGNQAASASPAKKSKG